MVNQIRSLVTPPLGVYLPKMKNEKKVKQQHRERGSPPTLPSKVSLSSFLPTSHTVGI
jgi:hypothetical protein